jgi:hypothetical protein
VAQAAPAGVAKSSSFYTRAVVNIGECGGELVHRRRAFARGSTPVRRDVSQRQPDQLGARLIVREVNWALDDLARLHVQTLDGVGGVSERRRVVENLVVELQRRRDICGAMFARSEPIRDKRPAQADTGCHQSPPNCPLSVQTAGTG